MTTPAPTVPAPTVAGLDQLRVQRRTLAVLAATQTLGGAGMSTVAAVGGLAAAQLSGSAAIGGLALTAGALGAALVGVPLARTAERAGRRTGLRRGYLIAATGALAATGAVAVGSWPLLIAASVLLGAATATTLAARFAATDLARPQQRGRALSVVLWATTTGAVTGPNLAAPAERLARAVGTVSLAGPYLLCVALFGAAALGVHAGLRPDPLLVSRAARTEPALPPDGSPRPAAGARHGCGRRRAGGDGRADGDGPTAPRPWRREPACRRHDDQRARGGNVRVSPLFGWLSDRVGRLPVLGLGAGLLTAAALVGATAAPHAVLQLTCALALLGLGWSAVLVSGSALLVDAVPAADRPRVQGRNDALMNVSGAVGGALAGGRHRHILPHPVRARDSPSRARAGRRRPARARPPLTVRLSSALTSGDGRLGGGGHAELRQHGGGVVVDRPARTAPGARRSRRWSGRRLPGRGSPAGDRPARPGRSASRSWGRAAPAGPLPCAAGAE